MNTKKYIFSFLAAGFLASLILTPLSSQALMQVPGSGNGRGWQAMSRPEIMGTITAVSGNTITVKDLRGNTGAIYTVDVTNAIIMKNGNSAKISDIIIGDKVVAQGLLASSVPNQPTIIATKINIGGKDISEKDLENENAKPRIVGVVTAISGDILKVRDNRRIIKGGEFTVNATNAIIMKNGNSAKISDIVVGDKVVVQGDSTVNTNNVPSSSLIIKATKINVGGKDVSEKDLENENNLKNPIIVGDGSPIIAGKVTAISGNTITIVNKSNVTYTVDATNAKVQSQGATSTVSNIAVNDNVIVQGTINGTSVTASLIIDQKQVQNQINSPDNQTENKPKPAGFFRRIGGWFKNLFGF